MVKLFSKNSNLCDHNPPTSQTDRQTTCDRNASLCTKVHRAVKSVYSFLRKKAWQWTGVVANVILYWVPDLRSRHTEHSLGCLSACPRHRETRSVGGPQRPCRHLAL